MPILAYGTRTIEYTLIRRDRKTLEISVLPNMSVEVVAPQQAPLEKIEAKILKRGLWIIEQQLFFKALQPFDGARSYVSGESHYYLGRRYRLKVVEATERVVKLQGQFLWVYTPDRSKPKHIQKQVQAWYKKQALRKFTERLAICHKRLAPENIPLPTLKIRLLHKRWGSCQPGKPGKIILNINLMKAPTYCIDYVVLHELCHLIIPNHSAAFYQLKERYLSDWKARKKLLEGVR